MYYVVRMKLRSGQHSSGGFTAQDYKYLPYGLEITQIYKDKSTAVLFFPYDSFEWARFMTTDTIGETKYAQDIR